MVCTPERRERKRPFDVRFRRERRSNSLRFGARSIRYRIRPLNSGFASTVPPNPRWVTQHDLQTRGVRAPSDTP
jgi:hypothetical protein